MMKKLMKRVREAESKELALTRRQYEEAFGGYKEGYEVMTEEFGETCEALNDAIGIYESLEAHNRVDVLPVLERKMLETACEAIQTAAMCRKMLESM